MLGSLNIMAQKHPGVPERRDVFIITKSNNYYFAITNLLPALHLFQADEFDAGADSQLAEDGGDQGEEDDEVEITGDDCRDDHQH